ncbi:ABC transporter G family member 24-like [Vigna umbellata]|uniref:ABC transporter G family member 24-like n=1 Tax=Vigna umbellata TaxID=87088 RepID=UPI001F5EE94B|nr:ABC transporter G family member 24-like [Vigna umbellata]
MCRWSTNSKHLWVPIVLFSLFLWMTQLQCQQMNDYDQIDSPAVLPLVTQLVYSQISNLTSIISQEISRESTFCVKDPDADWNQAFNFSTDLDFLASCIKKTRGDIAKRLCTAAEVKFFLDSLLGKSVSANYLKPNKNCNLTSWVSGCEPGWACSNLSSQKVDLKNSKEIPARTSNCQPCCEGFFCPHGITCMIPCPLGSYCPLAKLNKTTGVCEPYLYQLPPMQPNHTCGGANVWADVSSSSDIFCSAGSYCPTTTKRISCSSGHYCRMGSTSEKRCFKLSSCNSNTATQNMRAYGIMLIAALSTLLLIIYNCSDQVLTTRERRVAKSREAAARSARKTANARQRWQFAKDATMKGAMGLQAQLSRTFKKDAANLEKFKILKQANSEADVELLSHPRPKTSSMVASSSVATNKKGKEPSGLMQMIHEIENDPDIDDIENDPDTEIETRGKSVTANVSKGKQPHTHSQIFKYAYSQLEKEKAQQKENKKLTFSGVIKMATNTERRKRPLIEISFKDLTLTLKAQNKHILRYVTGKIKPGRITAVMGPSGAGKTTFLSALAGKALGCSVTGSILINGRNESIHSFKKITGFVPQDDIVHGNLTVEENLWFSAQCRLSVDLSKPEKVLVVERVIEFLGLQSVRNSLVGTVEKRGISGGQRKRVNVGLEMVMEPSLLILDEPTSGLDSASSQLLLRALRREALEGVNICMVVHQPSYALYKMFDDLILLGKGGLTVYHGSAKKVEEYFLGLGISIPERINPPDYFIDILEGLTTPGGSSGLSYKDLPVRWMLHNGYPIPLDMRQNAVQYDMSHSVNSANEIDPHGSGHADKTFAGELWQDMRNNVELRGEKIRHNFFKSKDLSDRKTPGVFKQYKYFLIRLSVSVLKVCHELDFVNAGDSMTANARQRWQFAKDATMKGAMGLQAQLSRTFKKDAANLEKFKILKQANSEADVELLSHPRPKTSSMVASSSVATNKKGKEPSGLMQMIHEIENDPDIDDIENDPDTEIETRGKSVTANVSKGKQPHTHSQIFKYAYSQLEKEKAQQKENKKLTFSGVIKMATNTERRKRPLIEISFKDLTLTLKAQNKHILRYVTGKIKPGRITAVMGPSGAGKTTFLSALAGKALGCSVTGSILINGRNESIHSFKKITGFVPQDDIVHGNLTVEENLWFSAQCRLSVDLSKPEKVLVVERVIEFLGLQSVRNSLVGTVEKRGISGGQRKRVNVGLEMVMEPSLLILDEPTSGLDSASSQLLLRALRREALEGVNICMVVHQPSYALYKMFDDLILLGKGGLTVYHGSAKKVEEYFLGLGINIPERINPPDYFIDILEGLTTPGGSSGLSYKDLPVRWMLHNGYPIPLDMRQNAVQYDMSHSVNSANEIDPHGSGHADKTFAGELWQDMRNNVELRGEKIRHNFFKSKDLSDRKTPGVFKQYKYFLIRVGKQRLREARMQAIDYLILLLAGACLGSLTKGSEQTFGAAGYTYTVIAVSLLCKIAALRSFSSEKLHHWRESDSGMSSLAYFLSKDTLDHFNTVIKPVVYLSMFYFFTNPRSTFADNYIVLLCLVYCVTGIAYALSIFFEPGAAQLWSVLLPVVLTLVATQRKDSKILKDIANLCYSKWALQALVVSNAERYQGVWLITRCGSLLKSGYNLHDWSLCISILILMGVIGRAIAFFCMVTFRKK